VPKKYTPFASGAEVLRHEVGGYAEIETRIGKPMQFPVVAAGNYDVVSETRDGITCRVATYAGIKKEAAERLINNFFAAAEYYKSLFDVPYPFNDFTIIERNTWGFGQAPPGVIFITKEAFDSVSDETSRLFSQGINERVVHEVAHAWWGHVAKMDSHEEQWITESFASYSAALFLQKMFGSEKRGNQEFKALMRFWQGSAEDIENGGSIYLANFQAFNTLDDRFARTALLYHKGPVVLHALRQELARRMGSPEEGDRHFFGMLRSFL
jgi:aminopeptidase N